VAKGIRAAVLTKKMPPWFADAHYGKFTNDRSLSQKEIDTLVAWADGGGNGGQARYAPKPVAFVEGWSIGSRMRCSRCRWTLMSRRREPLSIST